MLAGLMIDNVSDATSSQASAMSTIKKFLKSVQKVTPPTLQRRTSTNYMTYAACNSSRDMPDRQMHDLIGLMLSRCVRHDCQAGLIHFVYSQQLPVPYRRRIGRVQLEVKSMAPA